MICSKVSRSLEIRTLKHGNEIIATFGLQGLGGQWSGTFMNIHDSQAVNTKIHPTQRSVWDAREGSRHLPVARGLICSK